LLIIDEIELGLHEMFGVRENETLLGQRLMDTLRLAPTLVKQ
jgi:hypothetical protein